jgi:hypothetical protein
MLSIVVSVACAGTSPLAQTTGDPVRGKGL